MKKAHIIFILFLFALRVSAQGDTDTVVIHSAQIYFDFAKDEIRDTELERLNEISGHLQDDFSGFVRLTGHTDSIGTNSNNDDLSARRANQVIQHLVASGISPKVRFYTQFNGENQPVADNGSDQGRQQNRRVEVEILKIKTTEIVQEEIAEYVPDYVPEIPVKTTVSFIIKDEETEKSLEAKVVYKRYITDEAKTYLCQAGGANQINVDLDENQKMFFEFYAEGYFHNSVDYLVKKGQDNLIIILLKPIKEGNKLALKNLYFYGNQAKLLPKSIPELKRLKNSILLNPNVILEVGGHINYPNTHPDDVPEWSVNLSERRAEVIYNYLVNSGVNEKQLSFKGYSNTQMINPYATQEAQMKPNRRVEIKVMGYLKE